jgi:hypothetical protein
MPAHSEAAVLPGEHGAREISKPPPSPSATGLLFNHKGLYQTGKLLLARSFDFIRCAAEMRRVRSALVARYAAGSSKSGVITASENRSCHSIGDAQAHLLSQLE